MTTVALASGACKVREAKPPIITYLRPMTAQDIEDLNTISPGVGLKPVQQLRYAHHALARLLAQGTPFAEASSITGHSVARICSMSSGDPAFRELVSHYAALATKQFTDVHSRLAALGMTTVEELQERLEVEPSKFSNKDLFALAELTLDRAGAARNAIGDRGVNINVSFVASSTPEGEGKVIEATAVKEPSE